MLPELFKECIKSKDNEMDPAGILQAMVRCKHPKATDAVVELLEQKESSSRAYLHYWVMSIVRHLPAAEALPRLSALIPSLPDRLADALASAMVEMK